MSIRVQKKWSQLGRPAKTGDHMAPMGQGTIADISPENLQQVEALGGEATLVLEALETDSFIPRWKIIEIREA